MNKINPGQVLLISAAAFTTVGGFLMDWNKTHLFNDKWTPHAKFHDAMTILLGSLLGSGSLYLLLKKKKNTNQELSWATLLPAFFYVAQAGSFAFPGAKGLESEFPEVLPKAGPFRLNEGPFSAGMLAILVAGYVLESKRLTQVNE